jgi:hypothetical protein
LSCADFPFQVPGHGDSLCAKLPVHFLLSDRRVICSVQQAFFPTQALIDMFLHLVISLLLNVHARNHFAGRLVYYSTEFGV